MASLLYNALWDSKREVWYHALALLFSVIRDHNWSGSKGFLEVNKLFELDCDAQAAVWIIKVNLLTVLLMPLYVINLKLRLISWSPKLWNLVQFVEGKTVLEVSYITLEKH